jgi:methylmalonyl-CoA epimerase
MRVDHIGVAVKSLEESRRFFEDLGLSCSGEEEVPSQRVRVAFIPAGDTRLELLESTDPEGPIGKFIENRGTGLHHVCIEVSDLSAALDGLAEKEYRLINREPVDGAHGTRVAFVHPKSTGGVLLELMEKHG